MWTDSLSLHSFMLQDVLGSLTAVLAFAAVLYAPGYLVAQATDLFGFRRLRCLEQTAWSVALSFCVVPIATYLAARFAGISGVVWCLAASAVAAMLLLWRTRGTSHWSNRSILAGALIALGWTAFVLLMLIDAQVGKKLYFSVVMADQSYRIAFTDTVVRTGVPPANPLYFAGATAPMRYYYFWYVLCASVVKLAHVSARQAFVASSVWAGFGLLATVKLYTLHFFRWQRRQCAIALGLLLVTGADLLPALGNPVLQGSLNGDPEWWSVDPIDAWPDSLLWVPHHVASVLCCLLAFLLIWRTRETVDRSIRWWAGVLAALAFASAFGLSVYVAFGFALLMLAWLVRLLIVQHAERLLLCRRVAWVSVLSIAMLTPFLLELAGSLAHGANSPAGAGSGPATHLFSLSVRRMIDSGLLTGLPVFAGWNQTHPLLLDQSLRLLLLLPGLAMELGLFGAVLVMLLLAKRRVAPSPDGEACDTAIFFAVCGLIMTMFLSSSVITNNDFGYRAVMLPQFFLLLLTADVLGSWWLTGNPQAVAPTPGKRRLLYSLLGLGIVGSIYWAFLLRAWMPIEAPRIQNGYSQLPDDAFQIREAFATMNRVASANAVVSFRAPETEIHQKDEVMTPNEFYQRMLVMDTGRQMLNAEQKCAVHFGGDPAPCRAIQQETAALYASPAPSAEWAQAYCKRFGVLYMTLSHRDPAWTGAAGWPRTLPVIAVEPGFKIVRCAEDPPSHSPGNALVTGADSSLSSARPDGEP